MMLLPNNNTSKPQPLNNNNLKPKPCPLCLHSKPIMVACATTGCDYLDFSSEPKFIERMEGTHHKRTAETTHSPSLLMASSPNLPHTITVTWFFRSGFFLPSLGLLTGLRYHWRRSNFGLAVHATVEGVMHGRGFSENWVWVLDLGRELREKGEERDDRICAWRSRGGDQNT